MNLYNNNPLMNNQIPFINNNLNPNDLLFKLNEIENMIQKLDMRITRLENNLKDNNYHEPDNSLYML